MKTKEGRYKRICGHCRKPFETNDTKQRYCCVSCGSKASREMIKDESIALREKEFERKFNEKFRDYQYAGEYMQIDKPFRIKCLVCHDEFHRNASVLRSKKKIRCSNCIRVNKENILRKEKELRLFNQKIRRQEKERLAEENKTTYTKACPSCLIIYETINNSKVYCCKACAKKEQNKRKETVRRLRVKTNGAVDYDITLARLYKRDEGICYICNSKTDKKLHYNNNNYPTIEHVNPLSLGGLHTWDNVKLACRKCNTIKSNKI